MARVLRGLTLVVDSFHPEVAPALQVADLAFLVL